MKFTRKTTVLIDNMVLNRIEINVPNHNFQSRYSR